MEKNKTKKRILRALSIVLFLTAIATIVPFSGAKGPCILGYKSLCPFMPISTAIALYLAYTIHRFLGNMGRNSFSIDR
jgi:uncharacterized protein (DUF2062 family)